MIITTLIRNHISVTECISGKTQKLPFRISTTIELQNITTTSSITSTLVSWNIPR